MKNFGASYYLRREEIGLVVVATEENQTWTRQHSTDLTPRLTRSQMGAEMRTAHKLLGQANRRPRMGTLHLSGDPARPLRVPGRKSGGGQRLPSVLRELLAAHGPD